MTIGAIQSNTGASTFGGSRATMDTYQFLQLLIVELTSQNPMDPVKDRDFLAQMAQLNTAQQMERIGNMFTTFQAAGLIGREVEAALPSGVHITGKVEGVQIVAGRVLLTINGEAIPMESLRTIR
ncbi:MAG: flagellar hook capping protein [Fimbriimonadales bacterium]|nr:MAG: flagellar hook capping protein [Fimbriimonadales bacterium]